MAEDPAREEGDAVKASSHAPELAGADSEQRLVDRVRRGSESALGALFTRYASWLRRWAQGRLPVWARDGLDTSDLVQDALHGTFARISTLRSVHAAALRSYLRRAVENRIGDYQRRALFRRNQGGPSSEPPRLSDEAAPQLQQLLDKQTWKRYRHGLDRLTPRHRRLVRRPRRVRLQLSAARTDRAVVDAGRRAHGLPAGAEAAERRHAGWLPQVRRRPGFRGPIRRSDAPDPAACRGRRRASGALSTRPTVRFPRPARLTPCLVRFR